MSRKKSKMRGKSGLLTGLMIVSVGLMAGFHGFELAMSEQNGEIDHSSNSKRPGDERSAKAISKQVSALDQMISKSLEKNPGRNDQKGLAELIQSAQFTPEDDATNRSPAVNRALKRNRDPVQGNAQKDALTSFIEAATKAPLKKENGAKTKPRQIAANVKRAKLTQTANTPRAKAAPKNKIPFADSADLALFAADMPLPAKLIIHTARGRRVPPLSRTYGMPRNQSPLVPRKLASGKAFGGLAEREFQKRERRCMTTALYFEARSEPKAGQIAVGQVIMNRVRSPDYPDTICGVVYQGSHRRTGCQFSFTCDGKVDKPNNTTQWERSKRLANRVLEGRAWLKSIGHATHYHATYVKPRWRRKMARLKQIGRHIFYKSPKVSVTHTYQRYVTGKRS